MYVRERETERARARARSDTASADRPQDEVDGRKRLDAEPFKGRLLILQGLACSCVCVRACVFRSACRVTVE